MCIINKCSITVFKRLFKLLRSQFRAEQVFDTRILTGNLQNKNLLFCKFHCYALLLWLNLGQHYLSKMSLDTSFVKFENTNLRIGQLPLEGIYRRTKAHFPAMPHKSSLSIRINLNHATAISSVYVTICSPGMSTRCMFHVFSIAMKYSCISGRKSITLKW